MAIEYRLSYTASEINEKLGKIDSLAEKNALPTKTSDLTNDSGYVTEHDVNVKIEAIPTPDVSGQINTHNSSTIAHSDIREQLSQLSSKVTTNTRTIEKNSEDIATKANSADIYTKNETYSKTEIDEAIPTALSDLAADSTHRLVTDTEKSAWNSKAEISDIPTKVSELTNDKGYLTEHQSLDGLATEDYVDTKISEIPTPDVSGQINEHNEDTEAHSDIRDQIDAINDTIGTDDNLLGTWVFNDELNFDGLATDTEFSAKFTKEGSTDMYWGFLYCELAQGVYRFQFMITNPDGSFSGMNAYLTDTLWGMPKGWIDETYKTITITEAPTDETFIAWLKANATKTSGQTIFDKLNSLAPVATSGLIDDLSLGEGTELIFDCGDCGLDIEINEAGGEVFNITDPNETMTTEDNEAGGQTAIIN